MALNIERWKEQYAKRNPNDTIVRNGKRISRVSVITNKQLSRRDQYYKNAGFTSWERFWLISQSYDNIAMRQMAAERRILRYNSRQKGQGFYEFQKEIKKQYVDNGWRFAKPRPKKKEAAFNPFRLIDDVINRLDDDEYKKMRRKIRQARKKNIKDALKNTPKKKPTKASSFARKYKEKKGR